MSHFSYLPAGIFQARLTLATTSTVIIFMTWLSLVEGVKIDHRELLLMSLRFLQKVEKCMS